MVMRRGSVTIEINDFMAINVMVSVLLHDLEDVEFAVARLRLNMCPV
jgi:hypothetical protein